MDARTYLRCAERGLLMRQPALARAKAQRDARTAQQAVSDALKVQVPDFTTAVHPHIPHTSL